MLDKFLQRGKKKGAGDGEPKAKKPREKAAATSKSPSKSSKSPSKGGKKV